MIKIYHNNRCSKSRCGLQILEDSGKDFEIIKYIEDTPTSAELKDIIKLLGITPLQLIRKGEAIWKDNYKGKDLSDDAIVTAMVTYPKLIERPIIINGNRAVIGRPPELITNLINT